MTSGVYQIINQTNGNYYIGSAVNLQRRWKDHLYRLRRGQHKNRYLQRAFKKYGEATFIFSILESIEDSSQLISREQYYLDTLKPKYNLSPTARSNLGVQYTKESRKRMSKAQRGRILSKEHRRKLAEAQRGKHHSEETKQKMSKAHKGKQFSEAHKQKIREATSGERHYLYGKHHSAETCAKMSAAKKGERNFQYGKSRNVEHCKKLSEALKAYWRRFHIEKQEILDLGEETA